nr:S8 family peptidase [Desulfurococcales archaeon]
MAGSRAAGLAYSLLIALLLLAPVVASSYGPSDPVGGGFETVIMSVAPGFDSSLVERLGGYIVYEAELADVIIARVPSAAIEDLGRLPGVLGVSEDGVVYAFRHNRPGGSSQPPQVVPWGVEYINSTDAWAYATGFVDVNGDGDSEVEVAIIDTGIDRDHPDLRTNFKWGVSVLNGRITTRVDDRNGHGTHVAGTVAAVNNDIGVVGVSHSVEIYAIKALSNGGFGSWSDLIIAIDVAVKGPDGVIDSDGDGVVVGDPEDDAPEVISMSLGGSNPPPELHQVIIAAYNLGIVIVAAAGNDGASSPSYPAAYPEVIAVGAIDQNGDVPSWSNRNPEVTAPGVDILSTYPNDSYETLSGTSMATPHVSGVVALIQAARIANGLPPLPPGTENDTSTSTVRGILHTTALDLGDAGYDSLYGYGVVDAYRAVTSSIG